MKCFKDKYGDLDALHQETLQQEEGIFCDEKVAYQVTEVAISNWMAWQEDLIDDSQAYITALCNIIPAEKSEKMFKEKLAEARVSEPGRFSKAS